MEGLGRGLDNYLDVFSLSADIYFQKLTQYPIFKIFA